MNEQPEALRLAEYWETRAKDLQTWVDENDFVEFGYRPEGLKREQADQRRTAAELRRLHEENERLKSAVQGEPVAWMSKHTDGSVGFAATPAGIYPDTAYSISPLYTTPQPTVPERKPLMDEEIDFLWRKATMKPGLTLPMVRGFARAIEAAHGITGEQHG